MVRPCLVRHVREGPEVGLRRQGVTARVSRIFCPSIVSPVTTTEPGSGVRRPPASTMNASRSVTSRTVGSAGISRELLAATVLVDRERDRRAPGDLDHHGRAGRGADPLRDHEADALGEVLRRVLGRRRVHAAGPADRAADVLLVHPDVERAVAQQGVPVQPMPPKIRSGLAEPSVGGSASSAVCRLVAAARISLMMWSGDLSRAGDDALLGVEAHQPGDVRRARRPRPSPRAPRRGSPRGGRCARRPRWTSQPSRSVGVDHSSAGICSSSSVKSFTACHHTST